MTALPEHEHRDPVRTSLDTRYSDDAASPTPWSEAKERLTRAGVTWVVTCGPDGGPHATPLCPPSTAIGCSSTP